MRSVMPVVRRGGLVLAALASPAAARLPGGRAADRPAPRGSRGSRGSVGLGGGPRDGASGPGKPCCGRAARDAASGARERALAECRSRDGSGCVVWVRGRNGPVIEKGLGLDRTTRRQIQQGLHAEGFNPAVRTACSARRRGRRFAARGLRGEHWLPGTWTVPRPLRCGRAPPSSRITTPAETTLARYLRTFSNSNEGSCHDREIISFA